MTKPSHGRATSIFYAKTHAHMFWSVNQFTETLGYMYNVAQYLVSLTFGNFTLQ